ncbi:H+transporting two-sector ATPase alpha/beta subunit central region [Thalassoporum mexicanum PCC 7367]|uniref:V-type ATP synthase subunit A n=1 Tax=Thalassoporum mexicanum TaxID=3457544 RepID=UPI00029FFAE2|nr:V-type ATP synthase subunit A [Pseudanabaena sp. PCC 7367]AFY70876.1 H+transporting two-sector ATPase alpha/beta subunit central region [Pseudanabaena sp. PCC 7367]
MSGQSSVARVVGLNGNIATVELESGFLVKNEVAYIKNGEQTLKSEVIRIRGNRADMQVYEDIKGVRVGDKVDCTGEMLSVELGPGLLSKVFDGLQSPLNVLAEKHGFFLPKGEYVDALDRNQQWFFTPVARSGDRLIAGDVLGTVPEGSILHKVMVPFDLKGSVTVEFIQEGNFKVSDIVARVTDEQGKSKNVTMVQTWPVKKPLTEQMGSNRTIERLFPSELLNTTIRIIDTFFPIAKGGTACVPGPFGAGKTVLQQLIAKHSSIDVVIIVACGERAGEVVETLTEFPQITDPHTGRPLMERTILICNTSSMPVAAREASVYTGITLGEYYRQMGLDVLILADSTSRWAQALREMSGRLEEIPGEEAFPAYLDSYIKALYERAGVFKTRDESVGSLSIIGSVSPAGGNFEEPVTQSTMSTVKTFLGLSYNRAYRRFYPAIEPLISWSRYLDQLESYFEENFSHGWVDRVKACKDLLQRGDGINQMIQVTGEEGISVEDYATFQKALFIDMVYLQQDAFDDVDASTSTDRQKEAFGMVCDIVLDTDFVFDSKEAVRECFVQLTGLFKNLNYSPLNSSQYEEYRQKIQQTLNKNS